MHQRLRSVPAGRVAPRRTKGAPGKIVRAVTAPLPGSVLRGQGHMRGRVALQGQSRVLVLRSHDPLVWLHGHATPSYGTSRAYDLLRLHTHAHTSSSTLTCTQKNHGHAHALLHTHSHARPLPHTHIHHYLICCVLALSQLAVKRSPPCAPHLLSISCPSDSRHSLTAPSAPPAAAMLPLLHMHVIAAASSAHGCDERARHACCGTQRGACSDPLLRNCR
jgi:hypothetical protein